MKKEIKKVEYEKKYLQDAGTMMMNTWNYHGQLKGCKDPIYMYKQIFKRAYVDRSYGEFYVDEKNQLVGIFLAIPTKISFSFHQIPFYLETIWYWLLGRFGKRKIALSTIYHMERDTEEVMEQYEEYDEEISLFFVDESCRGQGLGKKMMDDYMTYCREHKRKKIVVLTDAGCNYSFYEQYGFQRKKEIHSEYFLRPELDKNTFCYVYHINIDTH